MAASGGNTMGLDAIYIMKTGDVEPGEPTGISNIDNNQVSNTAVFDLSGRQVNEESLRPGLYIRNGKKFIKN